jgi:hypothetical protein
MTTSVRDPANRNLRTRRADFNRHRCAPRATTHVMGALGADQQLGPRRWHINDGLWRRIQAVEQQDRKEISDQASGATMFDAFKKTRTGDSTVHDSRSHSAFPIIAILISDRSQHPNAATGFTRRHDPLGDCREPVGRPNWLRPRPRNIDHNNLVDKERRSDRGQPDLFCMSRAPQRSIGGRKKRRIEHGYSFSMSGNGSECTTATRFVARVSAT